MGNNGGLESKKSEGEKIEKSEMQLKEERLLRYTSDPDSFIECSEVICGVLRNPKSPLGVSVVIGNAKRSELDISQSEINRRIDSCCKQMDVMAEKERQGKITPVKGSFLNGIRNMGKRG